MPYVLERRGGDFAVNTETSGNQNAARITGLPGGGFVIVWADSSGLGGDTSLSGIKGQRFDADGNKLGGEFLINTAVATAQNQPNVTTLASGRFVVTWTDNSGTGGDASSASIKGQIFEANGTAVGGEFLVNSATASAQTSAVVTALAGGGFVVGWTDGSGQGGDNSGTGIKGQLFNDSGAKVGGEFLANTTISGAQTLPSATALASGGFVLAWVSAGQVKYQLFDAGAAPVGGEQTLPLTFVSNVGPVVGTAVGTGFVLVWSSDSDFDSDGFDLSAQLFDANGERIGREFQPNATSAGDQLNADVKALPDGGFMVTWYGPGADDVEAFGQVFAANGDRVGGEFVINSNIAGSQAVPKLAVLTSGDIAVTWQDFDGSGAGPRAQILTISNDGPTDLALSNLAVSETTIDFYAVATLSATSAALNGHFTYEIVSDSTGGAFGIDGDKLIVADNNRLDFESHPTVEVRIRATSHNGLTYEETVTLNVTDAAIEQRYAAGEEFVIDDASAMSHSIRTVSALASGGFVVTFGTGGSIGGTPEGLAARIYDEAGNPLGDSFEVVPEGLFTYHNAAGLASGGFVIVYLGDPVGNGPQVMAQLYDAAGNETGNAFPVGTTPSTIISTLDVAVLESGNFVVTWGTRLDESGAVVASDGHVLGQMFNQAGVALGGEFRINTTTAGEQEFPQVEALPNGGFVVVWRDFGPFAVKAQFYNAGAIKVGGEIDVVSGLPDDPLDARLAVLESGNVVVTWIEVIDESSEVELFEVKAQLIGANGAKIGTPFTVAAMGTPGGASYEVAAVPGGGFVVTWSSISLATLSLDDMDSFAQFYSATGAPAGDPFLVPVAAGDNEQAAIVEVLEGGELVFGWTRAFLDYGNFASDPHARIFELKEEVAGGPIVGTPGDDTLTGTPGDDEIQGLGGNDTLIGGTGADRLIGGSGNDVYHVDQAGDVVVEAVNEGSDYVVASASYALNIGAEVELISTSNNEGTAAINLIGNAFSQVLVGNAGANFLIGAGGGDLLVGLGGNDTYIAYANDRIVEAAGGGSDYVAAAGSYVLAADAEVELLSTTDNESFAAINLTGNALAQTVIGNFGVNTLDGGGGADLLVGFRGNDTYLVDSDDRVIETEGGGADYVAARSSFVLEAGASVELLSTSNNNGTAAINLTGNELNQTLVGNAGANVLRAGGGAGGDILVGLGGDDIYYLDGNDLVHEAAGGGYDYVVSISDFILNTGSEVELLSTGDNEGTQPLRLYGNDYGQVVVGNAGSNILDGKGGADVLVGLGGADAFTFTTVLGAGNVATIVDFSAVDDTIRLDDAVFTTLAPGALNPNAFVTGSAAQDADDRIVYNGATGQLFYDADGSGAGAAILFATLSGAPVVTASDFTVI